MSFSPNPNSNSYRHKDRYSYFNNIFLESLNFSNSFSSSKYSFRWQYYNTDIPQFKPNIVKANDPLISFYNEVEKSKLSNLNNYTSKPQTVYPNVTIMKIPVGSGKNANMNSPMNLLDMLLPELNKAIMDAEKHNKNLDSSGSEPKKLPLELTEVEMGYPFHILDVPIETIDDLISLGKDYETKYRDTKFRYNLNLRVLSQLVEPLEELNKMIGIKNIKMTIFNKIILYLQGLENKNKDFLHTVLCGGPGMGKTEVAKLIGKIYAKMGLLSKGNFIEAKLTDMKAGFVGQTELKTQKLLDEAKGNVLFFDEAYSLGSDDKIDSFSQSIIDILNPFMDRHKDDFVLILAGYKEDLLKRFFSGNQGLKSRIGLWLEIDPYTHIDIKNIFIKKVLDYEWKVDASNIDVEFFKSNLDSFKYYGRDIENLFSKCKIAHAKRVLKLMPEFKKTITMEDLLEGYKVYKKETVKDPREEISKYLLHSLYT